MKYIVLSADGPYVYIYKAPDEVADNLKKYCLEFEKWFDTEPRFEYRRRNGYDPMDELVNYLITEVNTDWKDQIEFVEEMKWVTFTDETPDEYMEAPWFNF